LVSQVSVKSPVYVSDRIRIVVGPVTSTCRTVGVPQPPHVPLVDQVAPDSVTVVSHVSVKSPVYVSDRIRIVVGPVTSTCRTVGVPQPPHVPLVDQVGAVVVQRRQRPPSQVPLAQSPGAPHMRPSEQAGHEPPQSTSASPGPRIPSRHAPIPASPAPRSTRPASSAPASVPPRSAPPESASPTLAPSTGPGPSGAEAASLATAASPRTAPSGLAPASRPSLGAQRPSRHGAPPAQSDEVRHDAPAAPWPPLAQLAATTAMAQTARIRPTARARRRASALG
jgi:hypothetical protein